MAYGAAMLEQKTENSATRLARVRRMVKTGAARAIRESAEVSLSELAAGAQVDRVTIHRWERGTRRPTGQAALRYLEALEELSR
jgi:DNA-binding transcriptional regulator YiaG